MKLRAKTVSEDLSRIAKKIEGLTDAAIGKTRQAYLMSKLGTDLGPDLKIVKQEARSLADFIKSTFSDKYEIIYTGEYKNIQSLILKDETEKARIAPEVQQIEKKAQRFNYRFWAAFSVPLEGKARFLDMDDFTFEDDPVSPSESHTLIKPEFIAPANIEDRDKIITQNITRWIDENGFTVEQFLAKRRPGRHAGGSAPQGRSLLHAVIEALDKKQLSAVSLPLDVVATLLDKNV